MDPVSHVTFGRALVALDSRRALGAGAIAACMVGSIAPDVDAVLMPVGWDVYLRHHQGGTHSLIGSIACAALTAAAVSGWVTLRSRQSQTVRPDAARPRYRCLWLAAWAGTLGHLLLDVISGADIGFFWPLGHPVALPLFAMADPWLCGTLVIGAVTLTLRPRRAGRTAAATVIAVAMLSAGKWSLYAKVQERDASSTAALSRRAETEWGSLTGWVTYEARAERVASHHVDALTGTVTPLLEVPRGLEEPLVVRSRQLATVRNLLAAHAVTFAIVIDAGTDKPQVLWSDLRYCGPPAGGGTTPWSPIDLGSGSALSCALWFGGEFNRAGLPTATIVHVGHLLQRRAVR